jgi:hypothetical protein
MLPREGFFPWAHENDFTAPDTLPQQVDSILQQISAPNVADANEVWLLTGENCDNPKTLAACLPLEDFFNSRYTIEKDERFYLERVRLYRKK